MTGITTITNASDATIYATVESARSVLESESRHEKELRQQARDGGLKVGAKGAEIGAHGGSSTTSEEVTAIAKHYSVRHAPNAGFIAIARGRQGELKVHASADQYFLTLSDGERVVAFRAPLDKTDHDYVHVTGSGESLNFDVSHPSPAIRSGDTISLKIGVKFVGLPSEAKNWPAGVLSSSAGEHTIFNMSNPAQAAVNSGDLVKLKGLVIGDCKDYCFMYSSKKGWIYYDLPSDNEKQLWIISKVGSASGPILAGDSVLFYNYHWRGAQLRPGPDSSWLACDDGQIGRAHV